MEIQTHQQEINPEWREDECTRLKWIQRDTTIKYSVCTLNGIWFEQRSYKRHFQDNWSNLNTGMVLDDVRKLRSY